MSCYRVPVFLACLVVMLASSEAQAQFFRRNGVNGGGQYQQPAYQQPQYQQPVQAIPANSGQPNSGQTNPAQPTVVQQSGYQPQRHWSQTLLENRDHDFGQVAKLAKTEHVFEFVNPLDTDLYFDHVRASCLCTRPKILTPVVKPGETARILAEFDTRGFSGQRGATVSVSIRKTQPYHESAELTLTVKGMIRTDVVMEPGEANFGSLKAGSGGKQTVMIKYAGNPEWAIQEFRTSSDLIKVELTEQVRDPNRRRVDYLITVEVPADMPKGDVTEHVTLLTNDPKTPELVLAVQGRIKVGIEASDIRLGTLDQGTAIQKDLLVRGDTTFAITGIQSSTPKVQFNAVDKVYRTFHKLTYRVDTTEPVELDGTVDIFTTDPDQPQVTLKLNAAVIGTTLASEGQEIAGEIK